MRTTQIVGGAHSYYKIVLRLENRIGDRPTVSKRSSETYPFVGLCRMR